MRVILAILLAAAAVVAKDVDAACTTAAQAQVQSSFKAAKDECSGVATGGECTDECKESLKSTVLVEDSFLRCVREPGRC